MAEPPLQSRASPGLRACPGLVSSSPDRRDVLPDRPPQSQGRCAHSRARRTPFSRGTGAGLSHAAPTPKLPPLSGQAWRAWLWPQGRVGRAAGGGPPASTAVRLPSTRPAARAPRGSEAEEDRPLPRQDQEGDRPEPLSLGRAAVPTIEWASAAAGSGQPSCSRGNEGALGVPALPTPAYANAPRAPPHPGTEAPGTKGIRGTRRRVWEDAESESRAPAGGPGRSGCGGGRPPTGHRTETGLGGTRCSPCPSDRRAAARRTRLGASASLAVWPCRGPRAAGPTECRAGPEGSPATATRGLVLGLQPARAARPCSGGPRGDWDPGLALGAQVPKTTRLSPHYIQW